MSRERLASKVEWEGGVLAALEYGIRSDLIQDADIRTLWQDLETRYLELTPIVDQLEQLLAKSIRSAA
jgi:hypothetical protein